jgi:hypothetical protein
MAGFSCAIKYDRCRFCSSLVDGCGPALRARVRRAACAIESAETASERTSLDRTGESAGGTWEFRFIEAGGTSADRDDRRSDGLSGLQGHVGARSPGPAKAECRVREAVPVSRGQMPRLPAVLALAIGWP